MTGTNQSTTIMDLVNTVGSLGIIKPSKTKTYDFLDSVGARTEFDQFNEYVRSHTDGALECFYAQVTLDGLDKLAQLYTKVTGQPFDQDKIIRQERRV